MHRSVLISALALATLAAWLSGCSGSSGLVGKWVTQSGPPSSGIAMQYEFHPDHSLIFTQTATIGKFKSVTVSKGTYAVNGDLLTLSEAPVGQTSTFPVPAILARAAARSHPKAAPLHTERYRFQMSGDTLTFFPADNANAPGVELQRQ